MSIEYLRQVTDQYFNNLEKTSNGIDRSFEFNDSKSNGIDNQPTQTSPETGSLWKSVVDTFEDLIVIFDQHGNVIESNEAGKSLINHISPEICKSPQKLSSHQVNINNRSYRLSSVNINSDRIACIARAVGNAQ